MLTTKIDQLYTMRQNRLAAQKKVDAMKEEEDRILAWVLDAMNTQGTTVLGGDLAKAEVKHKRKPVVEDWTKLNEHIIASGEVDLLQQRLKESAVTERWQEGIDVPGITSRDFEELSVTAIKK